MDINVAPKAKTIAEFCAAWRISRSFFYKLKNQQRAPRITYLGDKPVITPLAEDAWERERSAAPAPPPKRKRRNQRNPQVETAP